MKVIKLSTPYPFSCPPCNVVMLFELPVENNKHPNFEWRGEGQGCGFFVLRTYPIILRTMSQQFCRWFLLVSLSNLEEWDKSQSGNLVGNFLVGTCLTLPNLGFLWVFFKYPKISKSGNPLFFSCDYYRKEKFTCYKCLVFW